MPPTIGLPTGLPPQIYSTPTASTAAPQAQSINLNAQANPQMQQNLQDQKDRADQYQKNMTTEANYISNNVADMFAGRENAIGMQAAQMGANGMQARQTAGNAQQRITAGQQTQAMLGREKEYNDLVRGQGQMASAIASQQTADNSLGLQAYSTQNNANNSAFNQQLAMLNMQRTSPAMNPIYWG
jgi:hypothetical protein